MTIDIVPAARPIQGPAKVTRFGRLFVIDKVEDRLQRPRVTFEKRVASPNLTASRLALKTETPAASLQPRRIRPPWIYQKRYGIVGASQQRNLECNPRTLVAKIRRGGKSRIFPALNFRRSRERLKSYRLMTIEPLAGRSWRRFVDAIVNKDAGRSCRWKNGLAAVGDREPASWNRCCPQASSVSESVFPLAYLLNKTGQE